MSEISKEINRSGTVRLRNFPRRSEQSNSAQRMEVDGGVSESKRDDLDSSMLPTLEAGSPDMDLILESDDELGLAQVDSSGTKRRRSRRLAEKELLANGV